MINDMPDICEEKLRPTLHALMQYTHCVVHQSQPIYNILYLPSRFAISTLSSNTLVTTNCKQMVKSAKTAFYPT